jgi:hypothetical protein
MAVPCLHSFEGPIDRFGVGKSRKVWYTVLFLPPTRDHDALVCMRSWTPNG